jgi:hypothetical protein
MALAPILVGLAVLIFGRRLFWLFVGAAGFAIGLTFAHYFALGYLQGMASSIALVVGVLAALLAITLQRVAIGAAGFLVGGNILLELLRGSSLLMGQSEWLPFLIGGLAGALLIGAIFDWALIVLSSLLGAMLIAREVPVAPPLRMVLFVILLAVGFAVQAKMRGRGGKVLTPL